MKTAIAVTDKNELAFPVWHTATLLGALAVFAGLGVHFLHNATHVGANQRITGYFVSIVVEWTMAVWIIIGCNRQGANILSLLGEFTFRWRTVLRDGGLAIGFLALANAVLGLLSHLIAIAPSNAVRNILPHNASETIAFLGLTITASFCEELIYRGYLQRQFTAWTGNLSIGVMLQGIVFGASHAYQGLGMSFTISVYGCLFGVLAMWRKSLRPGMVAHLIQDAVGGLLMARSILK